MSVVRSLPLRTDPVRGEALDSWLEALAAYLRTPMGDLLRAVGLLEEHRQDGKALPCRAPWLVVLRAQESGNLSIATGLTRAALREMTLEHYDRRALFIDRERRVLVPRRNWRRVASTGSRFCPDCLGENGGRWQVTWRFGWSYACLKHHRLLADACPACGGRPRAAAHPGSLIPSPGRCDRPGPRPTAHTPHSRCLHDFATAATMRLAPGHPALLAQRDLLDTVAAGHGTFGVYRHCAQPAADVLADIKALGRRALFVMPAYRLAHLVPDDLLQTVLPGGTGLDACGRAVPDSAAGAAATVMAAWNILRQEDCRQAAGLMRHVLQASVDRGDWISPTVTRTWAKYASPRLNAVHLTAIAPRLRSVDQLRYRTAAPVPAHPSARRESGERRAAKTPGLIWPLWEVRLGTPRVRENLGGALAVSLMLVSSRTDLAPVAADLGAVVTQPVTTHVLQSLRGDPHWDAIQMALIRLADYLDAHEVPIDYARRRRLDYSDLLSLDAWRTVWHRALMPPAAANQRHGLARCFLFERASGLPWQRMPHPPHDTVAFRSRRTRFPFLLTQSLMDGLDRIGRAFLARNAIHDEPVFWQPPARLLDGLDLPRPDPDRLDIATLHALLGAGHTPQHLARALGADLRTLRYVMAQHPRPTPELSLETIRQLRSGRGIHSVHLAREILTKEHLEQLYLAQDRPFVDLERTTGVSRKTLAALADAYGIPRRSTTQRKKLDKQWLHEQYLIQGRTLADIGRETGMSAAAVAARARGHGIPVQNNRQPQQARYDFTSAPAVIRPSLHNTYAIRRLRIFLQVVRYPTLGEACRTHSLARGTLTQQLQRLESDLGGPLLIRAGRGRNLELTRLGKEVVRAVEGWAHTLVDQPRETWQRSAPRRSPTAGTKRRAPAGSTDDAPNVDCFPAHLQPAVRTYAGQRRLHRFLQAAAYPTLAAFCREAGISPSALTPQLQHLEQDLQGQLLIRGQCGHRMRLTDFGRNVLDTAQPYADQLATYTTDMS
ncbi:TniQ family protein [Streptomyces sp. T028]|uniref:TniQ family protein n=1 Tax=Streptomyces sp. T028 TaxID=3394379 RepID=UPI003A87D510